VVEERYQELIRLVQDRAGDSLRTAFQYDGDDWRALYIRDDVATTELGDTLDLILSRIHQDEPIIPGDEYEKLGGRRAAVEVYDRGVLINLPESAQTGTVISLDQEAATDLAGFIQHCYSTLDR